MNISFSDRLSNIVALTDALQRSSEDAAQARDESRALEANLFKTASSKEDYDSLCADLITFKSWMREQEPLECSPEDEEEEDFEPFNPDGPTIGEYVQATFHREGPMSTIYKAKASKSTTPHRVVALKAAAIAVQAPHNPAREAKLLAEASHEHVVPLIESFMSQEGRRVLVFPFLRQDLENLLRSGVITQEQTYMITKGLLSALQHIHSLGIIHRDVKPSNILLRGMNGPVYLADFGIAWSPTNEDEAPNRKIQDVGTTSYRPPELLFGSRTYDTSLDIWAAGCVIGEMVKKDHNPIFDSGPLGSELGLIKSIFQTLGTPNPGKCPSLVNLPDWNKVQFREFPEKSWQDILTGVPSDAVDLVSRMVVYEYTARLTAEQASQHPFVLRTER